MGMVVLRSTTPCVAVSSRKSSNLLTVISIVAVAAAGATSTGIMDSPNSTSDSSYIKSFSKKTSGTIKVRRRIGSPIRGPPNRLRSRSGTELLGELVEQPVQVLVPLAHFLDLLDRMQDRGVVLAAELPPDLRQGSLGQVFGQIHGDLTRIHDRAGVVLGLDLHQPQAELLGDRFLDRFDGHPARLGVNEVLQ